MRERYGPSFFPPHSSHLCVCVCVGDQTLKYGFDKNERCVKEIMGEIQVLQRLSHTNIVKCLGYGMEPRPFLLMELLEGGSLSQRLGFAPRVTGRFSQVGYLQPRRDFCLPC